VKPIAYLYLLSLTLCLGACGVEGVPDQKDTAAELGAATPAVEQAQAALAAAVDTDEKPTAQAATGTAQSATESGAPNAPSVPNVSAPVTNRPNTTTSTAPVVDFTGTTFYPEQIPGELIVLDGSNSTVANSELVSFEWEQVNTGAPIVDLINANTASAYFVAKTELNRERLKFKLTVVAANGETASSHFEYRWNIEAKEEIVVTVPNIIDNTPVISLDSIGFYTAGQTADYYAESVNSVYIADQTLNQIIHFDAATNAELKTFALTATPSELVYVESARSLYVGMEVTPYIAKINIDTGVQTEIDIAGPVQSLTSHAGRVYYTTDNGFYTSSLYSIASDDTISSHGSVNGSLIELNPVSGEVVAVNPGLSPATIYRYEVDSAGFVIELQSSRDLGSNARDIAFSPDGEKLAIATGSGNGSNYTIHDILASDLTVSNGAWDTGPYPNSADFNGTGTLFAATNNDNLVMFDANAHTFINRHYLSERKCGLNYYDVGHASFSNDGEYVFVKMTCGRNDEKTVLFYFPTSSA